MNTSVSLRLRNVLNWLTAAALILVGACFIGGCLYIYNVQGEYSRAIVAEVFSRIAVPTYVALALAAIGLVWDIASPSAQKRVCVPKAYQTALARLYASRATNTSTKKAVTDEQIRRRRLSVFRFVTAAIGTVCFLWYTLNPAHYDADINASMVRAVWVALPCFIVPFAVYLITARLTVKSFEREIALLKEMPKVTVDDESVIDSKQRSVLPFVRIALLVIAIAALVYGFVAGGTVDVLTKAINICTECIGLG